MGMKVTEITAARCDRLPPLRTSSPLAGHAALDKQEAPDLTSPGLLSF
jgi:hypothetical protein